MIEDAATIQTETPSEKTITLELDQRPVEGLKQMKEINTVAGIEAEAAEKEVGPGTRHKPIPEEGLNEADEADETLGP
jgi:hypothetical protein